MPTSASNPARFAVLHDTLESYVARQLAPGFDSAVLVNGELVDRFITGMADIEAQAPLRSDQIYRIYSNTKLITSIAALLLWEDGLLDLDAPVDQHLPQLSQRRVLLKAATRLEDSEPARSPITARHLLTHTAGLSYGFFNPGALLDAAYIQHKVHNPHTTLAEMMDALAPLPLAFHPGTAFEYSIATDVVARLVEVLSGQNFGDVIRSRIFQPLGMTDTGFVIPTEEQHRLAAFYVGSDPLRPMKPGLKRIQNAPYRNAYVQPFARQAGGGGLVSTMADMLALLRACQPEGAGPRLLKPATLPLLTCNQLPEGVWQRFAGTPLIPGKGYSLVGGVNLWTETPEHPEGRGELYWGGVGGTQWFINPRLHLGAALMVQRQMSFLHPFAMDWKREVYHAVTAK